jgi:hypothetical protein
MPQTSYLVTISGVTAAAPGDGFIDNTTVEQYVQAGAAAPTTFNQTVAKARANMRFKFLQQQLQFDANVYIANVVATGGTATSQPSSFVFTALVEQGDGTLHAYDETANGADLNGTAALKRWVARALVAMRTTPMAVLDPTAAPTIGNAMAYPRRGYRVEPIVTGPLAANLTAANSLITVVAQ